MGMGGCCASDPFAEGGAEAMPATSPTPAPLRLYMNNPAQALPGGPGQAGSSNSAGPAQPAHCRPREEQEYARLGRGMERGRAGDVICTGPWSGRPSFTSRFLLQLDPLCTESLPQPFSPGPKQAGSPGELEAQWPAPLLATADSRLLSTARPSSSSHFALSSPWASSPRGSLQLQLFRS